MKRIVVGGVPEHFNLPWHVAIENNKFLDKGIELSWIDVHGGTGAMCTALREGEIDMAIILTEGIIKDIINGNPSKLVTFYVRSPLLWGVHVGNHSALKGIDELEDAKAAISRFGSGSHLMAIVNGYEQGFDITQLKFEVIKNLAGGIASLKDGTADYFLWEHFTTKPYVDNNEIMRIANITTPWPCFVMAVRNDLLENDRETVKTIIKIINKQLKHFDNALENEELIKVFAERYKLDIADVKDWLKITRWSKKKNISKKKITNIQSKLKKFGVIENTVPTKELICKLF